MSEFFDTSNPYGIAPANSISMAEAPRHESGNALAANAEARAVAEVKAQVLMARQFPRDPRASMDNILRECDRPTLADRAVYVFPRGKETVSGPSIRLAEMMARNWGNCSFGLEVLERKTTGGSGGYSVMRAYAWDFETNTYIARQFEIKHYRSTRSGGYAITEDRDIYELEANMGSRRMRACILQMLPGDVTQVAVDKCRMVISDQVVAAMSDPKKRSAYVGKMIATFGSMGISQSDLEQYLSASSDVWTADHAVRLRELKNSLEDGAVQIGDVFKHLSNESQNQTITKDQATDLMQAIGATGRQGDISRDLKQMGISKIADTPVHMYERVKDIIAAYVDNHDNTADVPK